VLALLGAALAAGGRGSRAAYGARAAGRPARRLVSVHTPHLRVHVRRELLSLGVRAAREAESAWAALARDLVPPRGPVDLVVTDNADVSQGYASTFPTNRVVVFARPPVDEAALRFSDQWLRLVIVHELAHLFHLDRSRGPWRLAQYVFGRHRRRFPNQYGPAWLSEGLAVHAESARHRGGAGSSAPSTAWWWPRRRATATCAGWTSCRSAARRSPAGCRRTPMARCSSTASPPRPGRRGCAPSSTRRARSGTRSAWTARRAAPRTSFTNRVGRLRDSVARAARRRGRASRRRRGRRVAGTDDGRVVRRVSALARRHGAALRGERRAPR
jgi:hypothetical protein